MSTEYITKQCLILSDNSFPITLEVVGEPGKPFNKTHHSIRSFIRKKNLISLENPFQLFLNTFLDQNM